VDPWNFEDRTRDHDRLRDSLKRAQDFLEKHLPKVTHRPLDSNRLPHRPAEPRWKAPRTSTRILPTYALPGSPWLAAQEELDPAYVTQLAAAGDTLVAQVLPKGSGLAPSPTAADLAPTEDVQITQEIRDLSAQLGNDPVKIYEYVRNTIDFEPTWGSIKGSVLTRWEKSGNAFDTASLLIALLRAANIPTRYVLGTIQVPAAQAQNWVGGVATPQIAANILASGGVPASYSATHVTLEHVWVEAYVPYAHYRGVPLGPTGRTWIPLDASFKQYTYTQGLDVPTIVGFDANAFLQQAQAGATIDPVTGSATNVNQAFIENEANRLRTLLQTHVETNLPNATMADIAGGRSIAPTTLGLLPASLPYRAVATTSEAVALPGSLRHHVTITLLDEFGLSVVASVTRSLPEVATRKITVSYGPASSADLTILESYASQQATSIPAYLIRFVPEIRIDEALAATGPSISMGKNQAILITLEGPNQSSDQLRHDRVVGDYNLIGLELGNSSGRRVSESRARLLQTKARLERQEVASLTKGDIVGELLNASMLAYWAQLNLFARVAGDTRRAVLLRLPSEALNALTAEVSYAFDAPVMAKAGGLTMDVARSLLTPVSATGDKDAEKALSLSIGVTSSYLEANVFEQLLQSPGKGVSAAHVIRFANTQGIPVYQITQANLGTVLGNLALSEEAKADIQSAIAAGKVVYAPAAEVTINGWTGTGYFVIDPASGAGVFPISGGLAGGSINWSELISIELFFLALSASILLIPYALVTSLLAGIFISLLLWYVSIIADNLIKGRPWWTPPPASQIAGTLLSIGYQALIGAILTLTIGTLVWAPIVALGPLLVTVAVVLIAFMIIFDRQVNPPWEGRLAPHIPRSVLA
jgi:transglutaminase-like putative cysteine protease